MTATESSNSGFPSGYFTIRSVATGRLLDIETNKFEDGTEAILWPDTETSLVEGLRHPGSDNQVFFIDTNGALCSKASGHALDVEDRRLVLRHRRPMSRPFPNAYSHPLPQFSYSAPTGQISVTFSYDPSYPARERSSTLSSVISSPHSTHSVWGDHNYVLASVPLPKPRSFKDNAAHFLTHAMAHPLAILAHTNPEDARTGTFDLRDEELLEEDRGEGEEADDSPAPLRRVRVMPVTTTEHHITGKTRDRRRWQITPLRTSKAGYSR